MVDIDIGSLSMFGIWMALKKKEGLKEGENTYSFQRLLKQVHSRSVRLSAAHFAQ